MSDLQRQRQAIRKITDAWQLLANCEDQSLNLQGIVFRLEITGEELQGEIARSTYKERGLPEPAEEFT